MRIILFYCAAESVMAQYLSLLIGPLCTDQWESFLSSWACNGTGPEPPDWPTVRQPMRILVTVSFAAESVMAQDLSLLIGLTVRRPMRIILYVSCAAESVMAWLCADQWESFLLFLEQLSLWWNRTWASWLVWWWHSWSSSASPWRPSGSSGARPGHPASTTWPA